MAFRDWFRFFGTDKVLRGHLRFKSNVLEIDGRLFVASTNEEGERNWTLATRLTDMLVWAERRFGQRDLTYTIIGIEFAGAVPLIRYAGDGKHILIQLSLDCLNDLPQACYQLAHECIHLLAPTGKQDANNLEEGLATLYGEDYAAKWFRMPRNLGAPKYERVKDAVVKAIAKNPDFVLEIRRRKPAFVDFTPRDIVDATGLPQSDAEFLCAPFYNGHKN